MVDARRILCRSARFLGCTLLISGGTSALAENATQHFAAPADAVLRQVCVDTCYPYDPSASRTWVSAEYLHWWIKGNDLPPLVTTSPLGTARSDAGVLGPGTDVLFGDQRVDTGGRSGVRTTLGHWFDDAGSLGVELSWLQVFDGTESPDFVIQSDGSPIVARPFFEVNLQENAAELTAYTDPGGTVIAEGMVSVNTWSAMHSTSALLRSRLRQGPRGAIDLLGGYRYLRFRESLVVEEQVISRDPGGFVPVGTSFQLTDRFTTENDFHGGEIGLAAEFFYHRVRLQLLSKVALGNVHQTVGISGQTVTSVPPPAGTTSTTAGGLLTQPTNIGVYRDDEFAVLPEFGVNLDVPLTERWAFRVGYSLLLLNHVARTGEQIDMGINSTQIGGNPLVGPARPRPLIADSDFWTQGLQLGAVYTY